MKITKAPEPREIIDYFKEEFDLEFEVRDKYEYSGDEYYYGKCFYVELPYKRVSQKIYDDLIKQYCDEPISVKCLVSPECGFRSLAKQLSYQDIIVDGASHKVPFLIHTKNVEV